MLCCTALLWTQQTRCWSNRDNLELGKIEMCLARICRHKLMLALLGIRQHNLLRTFGATDAQLIGNESEPIACPAMRLARIYRVLAMLSVRQSLSLMLTVRQRSVMPGTRGVMPSTRGNAAAQVIAKET